MNTKSKRKIRIVDYGIANIIGGVINVNKKLLQYPELYQKVIAHELAHINGNKNIDVQERITWSMYKFIIKNPSTWCQFIPLWYMDDTLIYNKSMGLMWILGLTIGLFIFIAYLNPSIALYLAAILPFIALILLKLVFYGKDKKK